MDPKPNPSLSNYVAFANSPIWFSDPLGDTVKVRAGTGFLGLRKKDLTYKSGQLYNSDGSSYNGKIKGFLKQSLDALNDILSSREGGSMLEELESSQNVFTIVKRSNFTKTDELGQQYSHSGNEFVASNKYKAYANEWLTNPENESGLNALKKRGIDFSGGSVGIIYWNPKGGASLKELGGKPENRPSVFWGHELFHALDANRGQMNNRPFLRLSRNEW